MSSHSAYRKLQSGSTKEALFNSYKRELAGELPESSTPKEEPQPVKEEPPKKLDKAARAEASIKAREESYRKERERIDKQAQASKSALIGDESEREYRTLLIDAVRSHRVSVVDEFEDDGLTSHRPDGGMSNMSLQKTGASMLTSAIEGRGIYLKNTSTVSITSA